MPNDPIASNNVPGKKEAEEIFQILVKLRKEKKEIKRENLEEEISIILNKLAENINQFSNLTEVEKYLEFNEQTSFLRKELRILLEANKFTKKSVPDLQKILEREAAIAKKVFWHSADEMIHHSGVTDNPIVRHLMKRSSATDRELGIFMVSSSGKDPTPSASIERMLKEDANRLFDILTNPKNQRSKNELLMEFFSTITNKINIYLNEDIKWKQHLDIIDKTIRKPLEGATFNEEQVAKAKEEICRSYFASLLPIYFDNLQKNLASSNVNNLQIAIRIKNENDSLNKAYQNFYYDFSDSLLAKTSSASEPTTNLNLSLSESEKKRMLDSVFDSTPRSSIASSKSSSLSSAPPDVSLNASERNDMLNSVLGNSSQSESKKTRTTSTSISRTSEEHTSHDNSSARGERKEPGFLSKAASTLFHTEKSQKSPSIDNASSFTKHFIEHLEKSLTAQAALSQPFLPNADKPTAIRKQIAKGVGIFQDSPYTARLSTVMISLIEADADKMWKAYSQSKNSTDKKIMLADFYNEVTIRVDSALNTDKGKKIFQHYNNDADSILSDYITAVKKRCLNKYIYDYNPNQIPPSAAKNPNSSEVKKIAHKAQEFSKIISDTIENYLSNLSTTLSAIHKEKATTKAMQDIFSPAGTEKTQNKREEERGYLISKILHKTSSSLFGKKSNKSISANDLILAEKLKIIYEITQDKKFWEGNVGTIDKWREVDRIKEHIDLNKNSKKVRIVLERMAQNEPARLNEIFKECQKLAKEGFDNNNNSKNKVPGAFYAAVLTDKLDDFYKAIRKPKANERNKDFDNLISKAASAKEQRSKPRAK